VTQPEPDFHKKLGAFGNCADCGSVQNIYRRLDGSFVVACSQTASHNRFLPADTEFEKWEGVQTEEQSPYAKAALFAIGLAATILVVSILLRLALEPWIG
jgi:hypothetical protein